MMEWKWKERGRVVPGLTAEKKNYFVPFDFGNIIVNKETFLYLIQHTKENIDIHNGFSELNNFAIEIITENNFSFIYKLSVGVYTEINLNDRVIYGDSFILQTNNALLDSNLILQSTLKTNDIKIHSNIPIARKITLKVNNLNTLNENFFFHKVISTMNFQSFNHYFILAIQSFLSNIVVSNQSYIGLTPNNNNNDYLFYIESIEASKNIAKITENTEIIVSNYFDFIREDKRKFAVLNSDFTLNYDRNVGKNQTKELERDLNNNNNNSENNIISLEREFDSFTSNKFI